MAKGLQAPTVPYCFCTKGKQEDVPLVQMKKIVGLLGGAMISVMVLVALMRQSLQQAVTEVQGRPHYGHSSHPGRTGRPSINTLWSYTHTCGYFL